MYNPDFKDQHTNFLAAYGAICVGFYLYRSDGLLSLSIVFFALSIPLFIYIFKITITRLLTRIREGKVSACDGVIQYIKEFIYCSFISFCLIAVLILGKIYLYPSIF